jgi:16S rRNA (cytosine1402-N4)-methyltransferase
VNTLLEKPTTAPAPPTASPGHVPVLLAETIEALAPRRGGCYVDGTVGGGGHAAAILDRIGPDGRLLGLDRDASTLVRARERLAPFGSRCTLVHAAFDDLRAVLHAHGWPAVDGVLLDLGFSSVQLDSAGRGFSFQRDEPLDMRMDSGAATPTAADLLATASEAALADMLFRYGEEPAARRIAREIGRRRALAPLRTTGQLHAAVWSAVGGRHGLPTDPATRTFQALRIAVNDELGQLERVLPQALAVLQPAGRLAVITFHSLEDRIVKRHFTGAAAACICPPGLPECRCGHQPEVRLLWRKPRTAAAAELINNPRARSAKLRAVERLPGGDLAALSRSATTVPGRE